MESRPASRHFLERAMCVIEDLDPRSALREFAGLEQKAMLIGQGNKFELWDEQRWSDRRDEWLAGDDSDYKDLPAELESLSL